jgi:HNH endonuclease/AP2 domain
MAKKALRPIRIEGGVAYVPLSKGYEAIVDQSAAHLVSGFNWCAQVSGKTVYAVRNGKEEGLRHIKMHRVVASAPEGLVVDHIDGNGLNNQSSNLRLATKAQNAHNCANRRDNKSGHKGVFWVGRESKWAAKIKKDGTTHHLGHFKLLDDARAAYAEASQRLHGSFGRAP